MMISKRNLQVFLGTIFKELNFGAVIFLVKIHVGKTTVRPEFRRDLRHLIFK